MPGSTTEDSIVRLLRDRFGGHGNRLKTGIGDDAAVVRLKPSEDLVLTTDLMLEEVDFRRPWIRPEELGHKALAVNLSDLAAMGAKPLVYLAALALPPDLPPGWLTRFYEGMKRLGDAHGAVLAGGDLSHSPCGIQITVVAAGETRKRAPVLRSGGSSGDALFVTGRLGRSAAGLALLRRGTMRGRTAAEREALRAHRAPDPRCVVGEWLARTGMVSCMMDLSDGLSTDLPRLCEASGVGGELDGDRLPLFSASSSWGCNPLEMALHGGEDFELLFAVPGPKLARFEASYPKVFPAATVVGRLIRTKRVLWRVDARAGYESLPPLGYDHFAPRTRPKPV